MTKPMVAAALFSTLAVHAEESWKFLNLADWHSAEKYVYMEKNPEQHQKYYAYDLACVKNLHTRFGGDFILIPGDTNGGHWDRKEFIKRVFPGFTPEEAVLTAGKLCYDGLQEPFRDGGYPLMLVAVGDHEVGDNPWPVNSSVARCQPQFREAFANSFNKTPDGKFKYTRKIGAAPARPVGTAFEGTSYAYQHKNMLIVTVDVFYQESSKKKISDEGTVMGAVNGDHLKWLDFVLGEAHKDASIKHIIVQAHLPVLYPVRKVNSSGMLMTGNEDCDFWKTLRKHEVDIYFAGEVHANTVTKDPESDLVQIVSRGNFFNNVLVGEVTDDRLEFTIYDEEGGRRLANPDKDYIPFGRFVLDKSGAEKKFTAEGRLAFLDRTTRLLHFTFDEALPLGGVNIVGNKKKPKRGKGHDAAFLNHGSFGEQYSATAKTQGLVAGRNGGKSVKLGESSSVWVQSMGPLHSGHAISMSAWIKTTEEGNRLVINTASIWRGESPNANFMNLNLNNGMPEVMFTSKIALTAVDGTKLNDGEWHHIAVVMPKDDCMFSELKLYADGQPLATRLKGKNRKFFAVNSMQLSIGSLANSSKAYDDLPVEPFVGEIDEVSLWTRPLTDEEVAVDAK
ncbi:MAG: LamG domain-containing protein [Verrucomicrobiota bacterium]|nr:LamG domain-containing protein [Verrucomicrobiota bacterium]